MEFYKEILVWRRLGTGGAVRYRCLQNRAGKYAVHNADVFPAQGEEDSFSQVDNMFLELFLDESPEDRCDWYEEIEVAIEMHDKDFAGFGPLLPDN
jgi:hypothetical protein